MRNNKPLASEEILYVLVSTYMKYWFNILTTNGITGSHR